MKRSILFCALSLLASVAFAAEGPVNFPVGALTFQRPAAWEWVQVNSPMRKAQLKVPGKDAASSAEITFFHFGPGQGGDVQSNAQRWIAQFKGGADAQRIDWTEIDGRKTAMVSTEGTFNSGMPGGATTPMEGYALLGAIIEDPAGNVFVKMTGPAALIKEQREAFMTFLKGARKQ